MKDLFRPRKWSNLITSLLLLSIIATRCSQSNEHTPLLNDARLENRRKIAVAAILGRKKRLRELIKPGIDINFKVDRQLCSLPYGFFELALDDHLGHTPLSLAASNGRGSAVQLLLEAGADPNKCGACSAAVQGESKKALKSLLEWNHAKSRQYNGDCNKALFLAILDNHTDLVQLLLEHGVNPNDGTNPSLLYYAITSTWTSPSIIQALLRAGAHVNHQTLDGWTPVMHAAAHRYHGPLGDRKTVIRLLLQYGAAIPTPEQYNLLLERDRRALAQEIAKWQKEANLQAQQEQRLN